MLIQQFTMKGRRVPDPMNPGRTAIVGYLSAAGNTELAYTDPATGEDATAHPDENGWLDVPHEIGTQLCSHRQSGSGFYTPEEIGDEVRLGTFEGEPPRVSEPKRESKAAAGRRSGGRRAAQSDADSGDDGKDPGDDD